MHASFERWWNGISLRAKITGVTVLLLTFGLTVAGAGTMTVLRNYLLDQIDADLHTAYSALPSTIDLDTIKQYGLEQSLRNPYYLAVVDADGSIAYDNLSSDQTALRPDTSDLSLSRLSTLGSDVLTVSNATKTAQWRVLFVPGKVGSTSTQATLLVGTNLDSANAIITRYAVIFFGFAVAVVVLGAAITQLLVTSTFAPLRDVEKTAARFAAGDYSQRLGGATPNTEVGRLNRSLNTMLARIDRAFADRQRTVDQMRRFVGDASHELRTPLVSLRGYAELYRMGAIQNPEDVAQAMDRIEREAIRMGGLVEDLLELARLDEAKPPKLAAVDLLPIAQDAALDASAAAPLRRITVVVPAALDHPDAPPASTLPVPVQKATAANSATERPEAEKSAALAPATTLTGPIAFAGATLARLRRRRPPRDASVPLPVSVPLPEVGPIVLAEEAKLRQVVTNLMGNAMRYTPDDSPIELAVEVDHAGGFGAISIVDHGEGIPPQLREKIFQRFWRADTSRTRDTGGSGLGLAIVAGIVANHQGHVEVLETPGGGATFRVSIPLLPREVTPEKTPDAAPAAEKARIAF